MFKNSILSLFFVANSVVLCICSALYTIDSKNYTEQCGQSEYIITCICVIGAIIFGLCGAASFGFYICQLCEKCRSYKMSNFTLVLSAGCLIYSVAAGSGMLISLYFRFDPNCLVDGQSKRDFVFLWILAVYAILSNAALLGVSLFSSFKKEGNQTVFPVEANQAPPLPEKLEV